MSWVYVLSMPGSRLVKIGMTSRTPATRLKDNTKGPVPWRVERSWRTDAARLLEQLVHRRLDHVRLHGTEWFDVDVETAAEMIEITAATRGIKLMATA